MTVYGNRRGAQVVYDFMGFCATFGITGVKQRVRVIGGSHRFFDRSGEVVFRVPIADDLRGTRFLFQSAAGGTCPDEQCVSNLVEMVVG